MVSKAKDIYLGSVLVKVPGISTYQSAREANSVIHMTAHTCKTIICFGTRKKNDGIAPSIEQDLSMYYQNIVRNNIASGYS